MYSEIKMRSVFIRLKESFRKEPLLWLALFLCFGFSMIGANWGRVEDWNPDQMAFRPVPNNLMVGDYLKPPLNTYVHRLLVLNPVDVVMNGILHTDPKIRHQVRVLGVRILTSLHFCAAVALVYLSIRRCSGCRSASAVALLMATSAGMISYNHYGTADSPLLLWMMASFACALQAALSGRLGWAVAAGLLAGLSAACKYNGLGVAAAIPAFFLIQDGPKALLRTNLWLGSFAVPLGFIVGCPGAVFDRNRFVQDFLYNLYTTPVYCGDVSKAGYGLFIQSFPNLIGLPVSLLLIGCTAASILLLILRRLTKDEVVLLIGSLAVFTFYFITIGRFPRMEPRFVMLAVPFALMAASPAVMRIWKSLLIAVISILVTYNAVCCVIVGLRYVDDPRMSACRWAEGNFKTGDMIESIHSPSWENLVPGVKVLHTPIFTGRTERFKGIFGKNEVVSKGIEKYDADPSLEIFTRDALQKRNPDYVTFCSFAVSFSGDPMVQQYYKDHIAQKLGYHIVFKDVWWLPPQWAYPQRLDFMTPSMYILKRDEIAK